MTLSPPDAVKRDLETIASIVRRPRPSRRSDERNHLATWNGSEDGYRWSYYFSQQRTSRGFDKSRSKAIADPTGSVAVDDASKEKVRQQLAAASTLIQKARKELELAESLIERACDAGGKPRRLEQTAQSITGDELARLRHAKKQREKRGRGWGEA